MCLLFHIPNILLVHPGSGWVAEKVNFYLPCEDILQDLESIVCSTTLSRPPLLLKSMIQFNHEAVDEWWEVGQQLEFNNEVKSLSADPPSNIERENHTTAATKR